MRAFKYMLLGIALLFFLLWPMPVCAQTGPPVNVGGWAFQVPRLAILFAVVVVLLIPGMLLSVFFRHTGTLQPAAPLLRLASMLLDGFFLSALVLLSGFFLPNLAVRTGSALLMVGYFWLSWASSGQTLGQKIAGIRVVDHKQPGRPLRAWQALVRLVSLNALVISWITLPFSQRGALLHDVLSFSWVSSGWVQVVRRHWLVRVVNGMLWAVWIATLLFFAWTSRPAPLLRPLDIRPSGSDIVTLDLDSDGHNEALAFDQDRNGVVELLLVDTDGNGLTDLARVDLDQDRFGDYLALDRNEDGVAEIFDVDGDGNADMLDTDGDGRPDTQLTRNLSFSVCLYVLTGLLLIRLALDLLPTDVPSLPAVPSISLAWRLGLMAAWIMAALLALSVAAFRPGF